MAYGALLGALTGLALTALSYLGQQLAGLPSVPFVLFDWLARAAPGSVVTLFIGTMVAVIRGLNLGATDEVAKLIEQAIAAGMIVAIGAIFGMVIARLASRSRWSASSVGTAGGAVLFLLALALVFAAGAQGDPVVAMLWLGATIVGWGTLLGSWVGGATLQPSRTDRPAAASAISRRAFLSRAAAGSAAVALASFGLGRYLQESRTNTGAGQPLSAVAGATPLPAPATPVLVPGRTIQPVPGTRAEITPNEKFYRIDINIFPPSIPGDSWTLEVEGLFDRPRSLTMADITSLPAVTRPYTYGCISNPVGGDLIGNAYWTGVRASDLMNELGLKPEAKGLRIVSSDGFFEYVTRADLENPETLFVYGMNGTTLPVEHGFPLRIQIPNRYGMKQPKWITRFVGVDQEELGYWVVRGWSKEARPRIVSVIDTVDKGGQQNGKVPVGGIAWAGDRGIARVEVQVDGGPWEEATLAAPPLGPLAWIMWRYNWPAVSGRHTFRVRATDGTGALQVEAASPPEPDGATGYHSVTQNI